METKEMVFGASREFRKVLETADRYAVTDWPVLLLGETGVGKELVALRLHQRSTRRASRFLPINCAAVPPALFESELFGYERGAFSGAVHSSPGLLRQAREGTIFLDEIGDLDLSLQVKLLRFLDSGEVRAVGSSRVDHVSVRIIAATNVDLYAAVHEGTFRQDLLERLAVLTLPLPPLRDRVEDLEALALHFGATMGAEIEPGAISALSRYEWPGNVRQLRNFIVRAAVRSHQRITAEWVDKLLTEEIAKHERLPRAAGQDLLKGSLADIEKQVIVAKLKQCHGNRKRTAKELGIAKSTLHEKLRRWKTEGNEAAWPLSRWDSGASVHL